MKQNYLTINGENQLNDLVQVNFNNPYIQRKFAVTNKKLIRNLILKYRDDFAFGIKYWETPFSLIKEREVFYIRNNKKYQHLFDTPPVCIEYDLKTNSVDDIVNFIVA